MSYSNIFASTNGIQRMTPTAWNNVILNNGGGGGGGGVPSITGTDNQIAVNGTTGTAETTACILTFPNSLVQFPENITTYNGAGCVAIGIAAGNSNLDQTCICIGNNSGTNIGNTNVNNIFIGNEAGNVLDQGSDNIAIGQSALSTAVNIGNDNIAIGGNAGVSLIGAENVIIGANSGSGITGTANVIVGTNSGFTNSTGSGNILIGASLATSSIGASNEMNIGGNIIKSGAGNYNVNSCSQLYVNTDNSNATCIFEASSSGLATIGNLQQVNNIITPTQTVNYPLTSTLVGAGNGKVMTTAVSGGNCTFNLTPLIQASNFSTGQEIVVTDVSTNLVSLNLNTVYYNTSLVLSFGGTNTYNALLTMYKYGYHAIGILNLSGLTNCACDNSTMNMSSAQTPFVGSWQPLGNTLTTTTNFTITSISPPASYVVQLNINNSGALSINAAQVSFTTPIAYNLAAYANAVSFAFLTATVN